MNFSWNRRYSKPQFYLSSKIAYVPAVYFFLMCSIYGMFIFQFGKCSAKHSTAGCFCSETEETRSNLDKVLQYGEETDTDTIWNYLWVLSPPLLKRQISLAFDELDQVKC